MFDKDKTLEKVKEVIAERTGMFVEDIKAEYKLRTDLNFDSLDCIEIFMDIEDEFLIEINDQDSERIYNSGTISTIVEIVNKSISD